MSKLKWNIEQIKLLHDHTKHITTLSTGSIVVLVTFYEKLAKNPSWKFLLGVSLICFMTSILAATVAQVGIIDKADEEAEKKSRYTAIAFLVSWVTFGVAVLALCTFGVKNL